MTTTPKRREAPIQRAIDISFERGDTGQRMAGTVYAHDFQDKATVHELAGHLIDSEGREWRFSGGLEGVQFVSKETRGAPKKTGRNIALFLACCWLRSQGLISTNASKAAILRKLQDLWAEFNFSLSADEKSLRELVGAGESAVNGLHLLCHSNQADLAAGAVFATEWREFERREGGGFSVKGEGWRWQYGMESANREALILTVVPSQGKE